LLSLPRIGGDNTKVTVESNDSFDKALRTFKRKCIKEGLLADIRRGEYFVKPSIKKRLKSAKARTRKAKIGL
jgi:small subunit ribosomal protein S21